MLQSGLTSGVIIGLVIGLCVTGWAVFMLNQKYGQLRILMNSWTAVGQTPGTPLPPGTERDPLLNTIPEIVDTGKITISSFKV